MTGIVGFDCDQDCSPVIARAIERAKALGFTGLVAFRYLKNLSAAEVAAIFAAAAAATFPVWIVSIQENSAERALEGAAAATEDAATALGLAGALGQPQGSAIYAAATDFDEQASQDPTVSEYYVSFKAGIAGEGKLGSYGNGAVSAMLRAGVADYTWDCGGGGMRGTQADEAAKLETVEQNVGDKVGLDLGIDIDSDLVLVDPMQDANGIAQGFGGWSRVAA